MTPIFAFLLALISTLPCFADGRADPTTVSDSHEVENRVESGMVFDDVPGPQMFFIVKTKGFASQDEDSAENTRYLRVSISNVFKMHEQPNGRLSFMDFTLVPITQEKAEQLIKTQRNFGTTHMRYRKSDEGYTASVEVFPIGWSYYKESSTHEDDDIRAAIRKAKQNHKSQDELEYDPLADSEDDKIAEEELRKLTSKSFWTKFARLSADVAGLSYMGGRYTRKTDFIGIEGVRTEANMGLGMRTSENTKMRFSFGGTFKMGLYGRVADFSRFRLQDGRNFGEMNGYARAEFLATLAHVQFTAILQGGFSTYGSLEQEFGGLNQTSAALDKGDGGPGGSEGSGGSDVDMLFGGGGGSAESHPYFLFSVGGRF